MTRMSEREFEAFQGFVLATKIYWSRDIFTALKQEYQDRLAASDVKSKAPGPERVGELLAENTTNAFHGWFERHLQRMKYSGRLGLVPFHNSRRAELLAELDVPLPNGLLKLNPALPLPDYYTAVDVHQ